MYCRDLNYTEILKLLWTFTAVQQRMILRESLAVRQIACVSSLFNLSRDAVRLSLAANNSQERLAGPLVERLGEDLEWKDWKTGQKLLLALASYSGSGGDGGESNDSLSEFCPDHQYCRSAGGERRGTA